MSADDKTLFGIEKPIWKEYIESEKSLLYLKARQIFSKSAQLVAREEIDYGSNRYIEPFIKENYEEQTALNKHLADKENIDIVKVLNYVPELLAEFDERLWSDELYQNGWFKSDMQYAIESHIKNDEVREHTKMLLQSNEGERMTQEKVEKIDYCKEVQNSIIKEFDEYKQKLTSKSTDDVFNNHYEIHVKTELREVLLTEEGYLYDNAYKALYEEKGYILELLYNDFLSKDYSSVNTYEETADFINSYVEEYYSNIINSNSETEQETMENFEIEEEKVEQDKFLEKTAQGYEVLSIIKDNDDRNIAIIKREKDYVVAARYDTKDGRWAQGIYVNTLENAEKYRTEHYGIGKEKEDATKWLKARVSENALIHKYAKSSYMRMPLDSEYSNCTYNVFNNRIKEGTFKDTQERALSLLVPKDTKVSLFMNGDKVIDLSAEEFVQLVDGTRKEKYERVKMQINLPYEAVMKEYENTVLMAVPSSSKYKDFVYYLPKSVVSENTKDTKGGLVVNITDSFMVILRKGEERIELTANEYSDLVSNKAKEYKHNASEMNEYREQNESADDWKTVPISDKAIIAKYDNSVLLKMPNGFYAGYVYYLPKGMLKEDKDGLSIRIPDTFEVYIKDSEKNEYTLTAEELVSQVEGKIDDDYGTIYRKPSEEAVAAFEKMEQQLRENVPQEMLNRSNWVVVRTRENENTGRLDKFLINPYTGKFAESDNPDTWSDFRTACDFVKANGGVTLAYALDGKDNICCIDLDSCNDKDGKRSKLAEEVLARCGKTYIEESISGNGLHVFGKTNGMDLRAFSKERDMEFYQDTHFIAMTGEGSGYSELESFDKPAMTELLESKLERRAEWKNAGKGIEGLTSLSDREVLEKAFAAKNGDNFRRLYEGEDVRNNHSNSDMSLMNHLAFWCGHDLDQMLRINATSGLYRPDKPQSYYEHTAIKAIKSTSTYAPQKQNNIKPKANDIGNGKR